MTRKQTAAENPDYARWLGDGMDRGFITMLADALESEAAGASTGPMEQAHLVHMELGRILGVRDAIKGLRNPADEGVKRFTQADLDANYGNERRPAGVS